MSNQCGGDDPLGSPENVAVFLENATLHVVAADDSPAALVERLVGFSAARVIPFRSAHEYLACAREEAMTCLLLDLQLPDMTGLDLQQHLGREAPPTIFMGLSSDIVAAIRAMKAGAREFLIKPLDPRAVLTAIHYALEYNSLRRQQSTRLSSLKHRLAGLTRREKQVLPLVLSGLLNKQVAWQLGISEVTVKVHRHQIMRKMGAQSFADLVRMGQALGIGPPTVDEADCGDAAGLPLEMCPA